MTKQDEPKKKRSSSWISKKTKDGIEVDEKENPPKEDDVPSVSYYKLFQFSTPLDKLLILLAVIFGLVAGISIPMFYLLFGRSAGFLVDYCYTIGSNGTNPKIIEEAGRTLRDNMVWIVKLTCSLGVVILVSTYLTTFLLNYTALRQTFKIRELFFAKVLNQDISWYDQNKSGSFSSRMVDDIKKIEEGLGEKFGMIVYYETIYVASLIQGLVNGWEFALICMISVPVAMILMSIVSWISSKYSKQEMEAYADAGSVAEEVLSSIKTVVAFGGQAKEEARYNRFLESAKNNNIKRELFNGISVGINWFFTYCSFSLSFWYGVNLVIRESNYPPDEQVYDATNMITVFASVFCAQWHLGLASPYIETFGMAKGAAAKIFFIISSQPVINQSKGNGLKLDDVQGKISFHNVDFCYPSRKEIEVLRGFNLTINPGETVALVGNSGCGKSTCIQLIQRFYDVNSGYISIDDHKITDLDLDCLRSYIGVVGQEPVLFETTIAENIKYGFLKATQEEIETAAKKANIHTFISALPLGYSTIIGERGAQLSGGQKQRIAIARALVRIPAILLLDEATSALDTNSESMVQAALDKATRGCTTVIVAHRLSTVRKADRIFVMSQGQVHEEGSHDDLMKSKGEYYRLVMAQAIHSEGNEINQPTDPNQEALEKPENIEEPEKINKFYVQTDVNADTIKKITKSSSLWSFMKFNSPEWWLIIIGCVCCIITGGGIPLYSLFLGKVIGILSGQDMEAIRKEMDIYSICFIVIAVGIAAATVVQFYSLGIAGENLTLRLRSLMFKAMLHQEVGWFDDKNNGVGSLCARLSGEPESVQGVTGQRIATLLNAGSTVVTALTISFCYEWKISLVALCFAPIIVISSFMEQKILANESHDYYRALENSSKIAVEAISSIRTVESLGCEYIFHDLYMKELEPYVNKAKRNTHFRGVVYGIARSLQCFAYATGLYYGSTLVIYQELEIDSVFIVCESLIAGSMILANALAFAPNFSKGLIGADRILQLIHRTPKILNGLQDPERLISDSGNLNYRNVSFSYPNRPSVEVLTGLNLSVLKGKTVALVGSSGCGKSTVVQLLERFYDPTGGEITADDIGIQELKLPNLRFKFGMVSQEPNLFSKTIGDNIAYGDNDRTVTMEEIIRAAQQANIHNFIASLPLGYQTELGERGTQLSGGQKQRVAIARALVRNPKVLLLDEATSALDAESEAIVQEALNNAKVGRTCIIIAHRLSTIQTADVICVMNHGRIAEMGTHGELLSRKSFYHKLLSVQSSE